MTIAIGEARRSRASLSLLQIWLSPSFPVGAFAYSHGLEAAADLGLVGDRASLVDWIGRLLANGSARNDAICCAAAYRAAERSDRVGLAAVNELTLALCASSERRLETTQMGAAFASALRSAWPCARLALLPEDELAYPIAFGLAASGHGVSLEPALESFVLAFVSNVVSAAMRCTAIGQTDGQRAIAALLEASAASAHFAARATLDDLGSCCLAADIASMRHETLYSRMFRS